MNAARPKFKRNDNVSKEIQDQMEEVSRRRWLWVAPDGATFYVKDEGRARRSAATQGGQVFPPEC